MRPLTLALSLSMLAKFVTPPPNATAECAVGTPFGCVVIDESAPCYAAGFSGDSGNLDPLNGQFVVGTCENVQGSCMNAGQKHATCSFNCPFEGLSVLVDAVGDGEVKARGICDEEADAECGPLPRGCRQTACCTQSDAIGACTATSENWWFNYVSVKCEVSDGMDSAPHSAPASSGFVETILERFHRGEIVSGAYMTFTPYSAIALTCSADAGCFAGIPHCVDTAATRTCTI